SGSIILVSIWSVFKQDFYIADLLNGVLKTLNYIIGISQELPFASTEGIWLSNFSLVLLLIGLVFLMHFLIERKAKSFVVFLSFLASIFVFETYKNVNQLSKKFVGIYAFDDLTMCVVNGLN